MNRNQFNSPRTLSRYLDGELSDQELESFEAQWAENPDIIDVLEADARLQGGLAHLRHTGELDGLLKQRPSTFRRASKIALALAASLALLAVITSVRIAIRPDSSPVMLAASVSEFTEAGLRKPEGSEALEVFHTRSELYDATLQLTDSLKILELRVLLDVAVAPPYMARLFYRDKKSGTRTELGAIDGLQIAKDGFISVFLNAEQLRPGIHELRLTSEALTSASTDSFLINVEMPPVHR